MAPSYFAHKSIAELTVIGRIVVRLNAVVPKIVKILIDIRTSTAKPPITAATLAVSIRSMSPDLRSYLNPNHRSERPRQDSGNLSNFPNGNIARDLLLRSRRAQDRTHPWEAFRKSRQDRLHSNPIQSHTACKESAYLAIGTDGTWSLREWNLQNNSWDSKNQVTQTRGHTNHRSTALHSCTCHRKLWRDSGSARVGFGPSLVRVASRPRVHASRALRPAHSRARAPSQRRPAPNVTPL